MIDFEKDYLNLVDKVLISWIKKQWRNWWTISLFWQVIETEILRYWLFPLLTTRKIFYKWVIWEFAAFLRWPKTLEDFEKFGCNYWKKWANTDWSINVDYWNKWIDFWWVNQLENLIKDLKENPWSRRLLISAWDPTNIKNLSLPCCHFLYQFYVNTERNELELLWTQRSADLLVWVPSDIVLAAIFNIAVAKTVWLKPWKITMVFWDTHIYDEHIDWAIELVSREIRSKPNFIYTWDNIFDFIPEQLEIKNYTPDSKIDFLLKE